MTRKRILIIEDNADNARLTTMVLEMYGFASEVAERAETGITMVKNDPPDLILMDISLPGMDGLEATRILKSSEEASHIPIIALTAHAMDSDRERCFEAGCDGYLTKPIDPRRFGDQMNEFLQG